MKVTDRREQPEGNGSLDPNSTQFDAKINVEEIKDQSRTAGIVIPKPPFPRKLTRENLMLLADVECFDPGPERIFGQMISDNAFVDTFSEESEAGIQAKLVDERQSYMYFLKANKECLRMLEEKYGIVPQRGDIVIYRKNAGDYMTIGTVNYVNTYPLDFIGILRKKS